MSKYETIGVLKRDMEGDYENIPNLIWRILNGIVEVVGAFMLMVPVETAVSVEFPYSGILGLLLTRSLNLY
jgi:hypothetical protein